MAKWIIARATSGKCEGSEFCLRPDRNQPSEKKRPKFFSHRSKNQNWSGWISVDCIVTIGSPKITRAQFAYFAIHLVLIGNVAAEEARTERLFRGSDERLYNLQFGKIRLPDSEPALVIYIEPLRPTTTARWKK
jgi:hypothetical protein